MMSAILSIPLAIFITLYPLVSSTPHFCFPGYYIQKDTLQLLAGAKRRFDPHLSTGF